MTSLYLTELVNHPPRPKSAENKKEVITKKNTKFSKIKEDFLEYLIHEETRFADLEKIEDHYKHLAVKYFNKFNLNQNEVTRKMNKLKELEDTIAQKVLANVSMKKEDLITFYSNKIKETEIKIKIKSHDLECYQHMHERLYKSNYLIKKRLAEELKYEVTNEKHFKQYEIIKNNAILSVSKQKTMLHDIRSYDNLSHVKYGLEVDGKKKKFNELEFQVHTIKNDTLEIEKILEKTKIEIVATYNMIKDIKVLNSKMYGEKIIALRDYLKTKILLIQIYQTLGVKDLDEIIKKFNQQRFEYQSLYSQFLNINKVVADLNIIYTSLEQQHGLINNEINEKINCALSSKEEYQNDDSVITIMQRIKEVLMTNLSIKEALTMKEKSINQVNKYMITYNKKMKDSIRANVNLITSNIGNNIELINNPTDNQTWNKNSFKNLIHIFQIFSSKLFHLISLTFNFACGELFGYANSGSNTPKIHFTEDIKIVNVFHPLIVNSLEDMTVKAMQRLENKIKILSRTEKEIFKDRKNQTETKRK
jgi:hypothetical protein